MTGFERNEAEQLAKLEFEAQLALRCLDENGAITYDRIPAERVEQMVAEVGRVRHMVEQEPIHLQPPEMYTDEDSGEETVLLTSLELFIRDMNNFPLRFSPDSSGGEYWRRTGYIRRFRILFPDFDKALIDQSSAYYDARVAYGESLQRGESPVGSRPTRAESHERALMSAYAIASQLVDQDDEWIRDMSSPQSALVI